MATDNYRDALARLQAHYASEVNGRRNNAIASIDALIDSLRTLRDALNDGRVAAVPESDVRTIAPRTLVRLDDLRRAEQAFGPIKREIKALGMPETD